MKNVTKILSMLLALILVFGLTACDDILDSWRDDPKEKTNKESSNSSQGYSLEGEAGCYYGTYTATDYNGEQSQGSRNYFVFAYDQTYYLVRAKEPAEEAATYEKIGPEEYYKQKFGGTRLTVTKGTYDFYSSTMSYTETSRINDEQYLFTTYAMAFDHFGGLTFSWDTKNVYKGEEEPYETGQYEGKRK